MQYPVNSEDEANGIYVGANVRFTDDAKFSAGEFEGDTLTRELLSRPNWTNMSGRRGKIVSARYDTHPTAGDWLVYSVRLSCGSVIDVQNAWLRPAPALEQLARVADGPDLDGTEE